MANKKKSVAEAVEKRGGPQYLQAYDEMTLNYCLMGATDEDLAKFLHVSKTTIENWKLQKPSFVAAIKEGREESNARLYGTLYKQALGYSHKQQKPFVDASGDEHVVSFEEAIPRNAKAADILLRHRLKAWRDIDKIDVENTQPITFNFTVAPDRPLETSNVVN